MSAVSRRLSAMLAAALAFVLVVPSPAVSSRAHTVTAVAAGGVATASGGFAASATATSSASYPAAPSDTQYYRDRLVVKPADGQRSAVIEQATALGLKLTGEVPRVGWLQFSAPDASTAAVAEATLADAGTAANVERDAIMRADAVPNDPRYYTQWSLKNTGVPTGTAGVDIGAEKAWDYGTGSKDIVVAVVDTGVQTTHPDLAENIWVNTGEIPGNGIDDDRNGYIDDVNGWDFLHKDASVFDAADNEKHGTHVSGTIAAVGNNGIGVTGVNWHARIMPLKFLDPIVGGAGADGAKAIIYAADNGARVINCSWGGGPSSPVEDALRYAALKGVIVPVAAGNAAKNIDTSPVYPASSASTNVVTVAATDQSDNLASFSNWGASTVELAAPGVEITSTIPITSAGLFVTDSPFKVAFMAFPVESVLDVARRTQIVKASFLHLVAGRNTPVLLVDDSRPVLAGEAPGARSAKWLEALTGAGPTNVTTWDVEANGRPTLTDMSGKVVVWYTGAMDLRWYPTYGSLDTADRALLRSYLDAGGRLLLSGGDIAGDLLLYGGDPAFARGYLHAACSDYKSDTSDVVGVAGSTLQGFSAEIDHEDTLLRNWPAGSDDIRPADSYARPILSWSGYAEMSGTSMATPHASGALALLMSQDASASSAEVLQRTLAAAKPVAALAGKVSTGARLDLGMASGPYPVAPAITVPANRATLHWADPQVLKYTPQVAPLPGELYRSQLGTPTELLTNGGFEDGTTTGFSAGGNAAFVVTSTPGAAHSGAWGARSAPIAGDQTSMLGATVNVPPQGAELSFWYWLDAQNYYDYAYLVIDGFIQAQFRTSPTPWTFYSRQLPAGTHAVWWIYRKDAFTSEGRDAFGLDDVHIRSYQWTDLSTEPTSATQVSFTVPQVYTTAARLRVRSEALARVSPWSTIDVTLTGDVTPPAPPTSLVGSATPDGGVRLTWTDPTDADFASTRIVRKLGAVPASPDDGTIVSEDRSQQATDYGLPNGVNVGYAAFAQDTWGNWSTAATTTVTAIDTVAPGTPGLFFAERSGNDVLLSWMEPPDRDLARIRVLRRSGTPPTGPDDPAAVVVNDGRGVSAVDVGAATATETTLYYAAWAADPTPNYSAPATDALTIDTIAPYGTFKLANGAFSSASATVSADSSITGATEMRFDTGTGFGPWQPYQASVLVTLPGTGTRTVYAQYRDAAGNVTSLSDSIYIGVVTPPPGGGVLPPPVPPEGSMVLAGGASWVTTLTVSVESSITGATEMRFDPGDGFGPWLPFATFAQLTLPSAQGPRNVRAEYRAADGSVLSQSATITVDTLAPRDPLAPRASVSATGAVLSWVAPADAIGVWVWRSIAGGPYSIVATMSAAATGYVDVRPPVGPVSYRLSAFDEHGLVSGLSTATDVVVRRATRTTARQLTATSVRVVLADQFGLPLANRYVSVQVRTATGWKTIARGRTSSTGRVIVPVRVLRSVYVRAVFTGETGYALSRSAPLLFRR